MTEGLQSEDILGFQCIPCPLINEAFSSCKRCNGQACLSWGTSRRLTSLRKRIKKTEEQEKAQMEKKKKHKVNLKRDMRSLQKISSAMRSRKLPFYPGFLSTKKEGM